MKLLIDIPMVPTANSFIFRIHDKQILVTKAVGTKEALYKKVASTPDIETRRAAVGKTFKVRTKGHSMLDPSHRWGHGHRFNRETTGGAAASFTLPLVVFAWIWFGRDTIRSTQGKN